MLSPCLFITIFFTIYFLLHLYLYFRLPKRGLFSTLLLFLGFLSPLFLRLSDHYLSQKLSFIIGFSALFWMGFLLYLVVLDLLLRPFTKKFFPSFILATILSLYSYYETLKPEVIYITFPTKKLPKQLVSFRILHISDLHLGPVMGLDKIELVKRAIEKYKPHLIISTGDLVDGNMENRENLKKALRELKAVYGKFAIVGNHEYYRGIEKALAFTEEAGFKVLRGEIFQVEDFLFLVGLDDDDCRHFHKCRGPLEEELLLKDLPKDKFILLLKHKPKINDKAIGFFDLMLSGHTHGGLYYPIGRWLLRYLFSLEYPGLHFLGKGSYLFVSKGLGTGGPPMRFLSPPDLAVIELKDISKHPQALLPSLQVLSDPL